MEKWPIPRRYTMSYEREERSRRRAEELRSGRRPWLNDQANQAADKAGLTPKEARRFHDYIHSLHDDDLKFKDLVIEALEFKGKEDDEDN